VTTALGLDRQARLMAMAESCVTGAPPETPRTAFERSLRRLDFSAPGLVDAVDVLLAAWPRLLPSLERCRADILAPAFAGMRCPPSAMSAGLTASVPASGRAVLALGWVERRWRADGALAAKVRVSAYCDRSGQAFWDFGVAGRHAPPIASLRNGVRAAAAIAPEYRARLDLTPSHRKAAWLALRLGGRPVEPQRYRTALRQGRWDEIRRDTLSFTLERGLPASAELRVANR
jgi:hypothetical protein